MDLAGLRREVLRLIRELKTTEAKHAAQIATLAAALAAVNAKTQRVAIDLSPLAAGVTTTDITWPSPFPDAAYGAYPTVIHGAANLGQVFVAVQAGKTGAGCTILIRNTSGGAISAGLDVLGVRT